MPGELRDLFHDARREPYRCWWATPGMYFIIRDKPQRSPQAASPASRLNPGHGRNRYSSYKHIAFLSLQYKFCCLCWRMKRPPVLLGDQCGRLFEQVLLRGRRCCLFERRISRGSTRPGGRVNPKRFFNYQRHSSSCPVRICSAR